MTHLLSLAHAKHSQSFTSAVANVFVTALALWLPLTPLFFLLRRILDDRSGTKWVFVFLLLIAPAFLSACVLLWLCIASITIIKHS